MSTAGGLTGKERSSGINLWIFILIVALAALGGNVFWGNQKSTEESNAQRLVADIQVKSQQIATYASEAASGNFDSFEELRSTQTDIQKSLNALRQGSEEFGVPSYQNEGAVGAKLTELTQVWGPVNQNATSILEREDLVLNLTDTAGEFSATVPRLQPLMDSVVRDMVSSGTATSGQIYTAAQQILFADRMVRRVTEILQGGSVATSAADNLALDAARFGQILDGLMNGSDSVRRVTSPGARNTLEEVNDIYTGMQANVDSIIEGSTSLFEVKEASDQIVLDSKQMLDSANNVQQALINLPGERPLPSFTVTLISGALAILGLIGLLYSLYRDQSRRFRGTQELNQRNQEAILRLLDEMGSLAEGDLTVRATVTEDITGAIADSINFAVEALRSLVTTINETAVQVAAAAQETQATAIHLAEAAEHQAQQITSASAAINEIAVSIDEVSKNSAESADVAQRSVQIAAKGAEVVRQTIQGMDSIRDQIQETSKRIKRLGESSQEIGSIIELINDISEQTNILALNAAIQAASAGEAGRGFAVVADEVQRLAERASNATKRIETLVQTIQADTNEAVSSMEQTTAEVVAGARLAEDAGLALGEIEKVSNDLADLIQNISEAARQQSAAATNISATMNVIQEITSQTSMGASQTAESIGNLAQLAADLRRSVADFKLPG
ncbi:MAG: type IV pili methyl-accepting chemotaxis transducer N-terminal domain-containing protein [Rhodanobacteraceae bacterium]|nr:type IV pili methyl-accepting chemotaxis transducer N-terminal domain-containing protein [Rhodanobacteraceae bacterium]HRY00079.1 methyl-accepting chemotaxis protein [Xanthomonadaceae bacterium]